MQVFYEWLWVKAEWMEMHRLWRWCINNSATLSRFLFVLLFIALCCNEHRDIKRTENKPLWQTIDIPDSDKRWANKAPRECQVTGTIVCVINFRLIMLILGWHSASAVWVWVWPGVCKTLTNISFQFPDIWYSIYDIARCHKTLLNRLLTKASQIFHLSSKVYCQSLKVDLEWGQNPIVLSGQVN